MSEDDKKLYEELILKLEYLNNLSFNQMGITKQICEMLYERFSDRKGVTFLDELQELRRKRDANSL